MPEHSTPREDVEDLIRSSYATGESSKDELGKEVSRLADGTPVRLSQQGREWQGRYVPDVALTIVRSDTEKGTPIYIVRDEEWNEYCVQTTDVEVDTDRSVDQRRTA